jgi:hypothetical protein
MADNIKEEVVPEQTIMPEIENDEFDFIVTDENEPEVDQEKVELQTKLAEQQAKLDELMAAQNNVQMDNASQKQMEELANVLKTSIQSAQPEKPSADPQAEYMKLVEDVRSNWHSDPAGNALKLVEPLMSQMQQKMSSKVSTLELKTSKLAALSSPDKPIYDKYADEVEQLVSSLPPSENTYQEAIKAVKANHMDDLVNDMVNQKLDELLAAKGLQNPANPSAVAQQSDVTLAGHNSSTNAQRAAEQKVRITATEQQKLQKYAITHSINWDVPKYRNMLVNAYKAGSLKI